jgi:hypothetical protein
MVSPAESNTNWKSLYRVEEEEVRPGRVSTVLAAPLP